MNKALEQLKLTDWDTIALTIGQKFLYCLLIFLGFWLVKTISHRLLKKALGKGGLITAQDLTRQQTLLKLTLSLIDYGLYFLMGYWWLYIWGLPISSLLAGAGLAGLAIGLGAQGFLNDLINGFFILLERQYDVGDTIRLQTVTGKVTNLGIRTTQLQSRDGSVHFIPNRNITLVTNLSRQPMLVQIDLPLPFDSDTPAVRSAIARVNQEKWQSYPEILEEPTIVGPALSAWENHVFRVEILVENGQQRAITQTFYELYQEALRQI